ncbi:MAG: hypothetical protein JWM95_3480 [Gemmatimonadetes bacterium]|nr:hypothetical protein [Gemmatimonadota bacterium]
MVEVFVSRLGRDSASDACVVVLQEKDGTRVLPIWIGTAEAASIFEKVHNIVRPRPFTHDLVRSIIVGMGATLRRVQITRVEDRTYIAELHLDRADAVILTIDARPSDSIAIALRFKAPIFAAEELLVDADEVDDSADDDDTGTNPGQVESSSAEVRNDADLSAEQLKRYLELLRPEDFGKFNP